MNKTHTPSVQLGKWLTFYTLEEAAVKSIPKSSEKIFSKLKKGLPPSNLSWSSSRSDSQMLLFQAIRPRRPFHLLTHTSHTCSSYLIAILSICTLSHFISTYTEDVKNVCLQWSHELYFKLIYRNLLHKKKRHHGNKLVHKSHFNCWPTAYSH